MTGELCGCVLSRRGLIFLYGDAARKPFAKVEPNNAPDSSTEEEGLVKDFNPTKPILVLDQYILGRFPVIEISHHWHSLHR